MMVFLTQNWTRD